MALPSKKEVEDLVSSLNEVAGGYADSADLNGYISRVQIIAKAKDLVRALITPDQVPNYHGLNVSVLSCLRCWSCVGLTAFVHHADRGARGHPHLHEAKSPGCNSKNGLYFVRGSFQGDRRAGFPPRYGAVDYWNGLRVC
jgi:hypothetical protein